MVEIRVEGKVYDFELKLVAVSEIKPDNKNPRETFNKTDMKQLKQSIVRHKAVIMPVWLHKVQSVWQLIDGEKRWRSLKEINEDWCEKVLAFAYPYRIADDHLISLRSSIQELQKNWTSKERYTLIYNTAINLGVEKTAEIFNKSKESIGNIIEIAKLSKRIRATTKPVEYAKDLIALEKRMKLPKETFELILQKINTGKITNHQQIRKIKLILQNDKAKREFLKPLSDFSDSYVYIHLTKMLQDLNSNSYKDKQIDVIKDKISDFLYG